MIGDLRLSQVEFGAPQFLWLLIAPALLLVVAWPWRFARRAADLRRLRDRRTVPVREYFSFAGDLPFWLCVVVASACLVLAVARPQGPSTALGRAAIDLVILQDGSASMQVADVPMRPFDSRVAGAPRQAPGQSNSGAGTRWQRSMVFLRQMGNALSWTGDRMALTVFAHIATPQVRLTRDPNTVFFFLDNLQATPPFRLADETTWDTNLEQGIAWGLRLIDKDREVHGPSPNAKVFVLISDGEAWSGEVARSLALAAQAQVPLHVVGVGTLAGAMLPEVPLPDGTNEPSPGRSRLDRPSLQRIAAAGGGQYFELDRDPDVAIANAIIDAGRRAAPDLAMSSTDRGQGARVASAGPGQAPTPNSADPRTEYYWPLLAAAVALAAVGLLFLREPPQLWIQLAGAALSLVTIGRLLWK